MGERADAIASHIREQREELDEDLRELECKVKGQFDWRERIGKRPFASVGLAAVAGFLSWVLVRR